MEQLMWKIPASDNFLRYMNAIGFTGTIPEFEHVYLGRQLTQDDSNSIAEQVLMNVNNFTTRTNIELEGRIFYFDFLNKMWYVLVDTK